MKLEKKKSAKGKKKTVRKILPPQKGAQTTAPLKRKHDQLEEKKIK